LEIGDELFCGGASGTVNKQVSIDWLKLKILPLWGNFEKGGPHSIVILDNASIHMAEEIVILIQGKGAYTKCTAVFSPVINPLEKMFFIYKASHVFALGNDTPDIALGELKMWISYQGFEHRHKKTRDCGSSGYYFYHGGCCYYY
jgi:hypothetical protein